MQELFIFQHKNSSYFDMDWVGCPISFLIWVGMDLDPTLRGGMELGLKICPVQISTLYAVPSGRSVCCALWPLCMLCPAVGGRRRHGSLHSKCRPQAWKIATSSGPRSSGDIKARKLSDEINFPQRKTRLNQ